MATKESGEDTLDEALNDKARIEELSSEEEDYGHAENAAAELDGIPFPGKGMPKPRTQDELPLWMRTATIDLFYDDFKTTSSEAQTKTLAECLPLLTGRDTQGLPLNNHGLPHLRRKAHADFLRGFLGELPSGFAALDASRPWLLYWCIAGLSFLGEDVSGYKQRLMATLIPLQNSTGGFGGGHGQLSHCACTYAAVLALTTVGGLEMIDRKAMWRWLGTVKQADGGFCMAIGAEEDIRGAYSAMTILTLLNLPLELPPDAPTRKVGLQTFTDGLGEWVGRCQTYEGGIGGAPTNEAHGAYAFCALACLSILDAPHKSIPKYLDIPSLISWLVDKQTTPEGGFAGRTNKLVDACYSHWVGGCWSLIQAALPAGNTEALWNREALVRYLLCCCQQPGKKGGMRDKPSTRPDGYHTNYSLSGLSAAQNHYHYDRDAATVDKGSGRLLAGFNWRGEKSSSEEMEVLGIEEEDVVEFVHPVFVVPFVAVEAAKEQFSASAL